MKQKIDPIFFKYFLRNDRTLEQGYIDVVLKIGPRQGTHAFQFSSNLQSSSSSFVYKTGFTKTVGPAVESFEQVVSTFEVDVLIKILKALRF